MLRDHNVVTADGPTVRRDHIVVTLNLNLLVFQYHPVEHINEDMADVNSANMEGSDEPSLDGAHFSTTVDMSLDMSCVSADKVSITLSPVEHMNVDMADVNTEQCENGRIGPTVA